MTNKQELRLELKAARNAISEDNRDTAAASLSANVAKLPDYTNAHNIALYWPHDNEISTLPILHMALNEHKNCFLPVLLIDPRQKLAFAPYSLETSLVKNRYGILEPELTFDTMISLAELDIIFVPVVGFDRAGRRLGRGGGFYDATFAQLHNINRKKWPKLIGLAYNCQEVGTIPENTWDWRLDTIVTEQEIINLNSD